MAQDPHNVPETGAAPPSQRFWAWVRRATLVGLAVSLLVHVVILAIASLIWFSLPASDSQGTGDVPVEFAVATQADLADATDASFESEEVSLADFDLESMAEPTDLEASFDDFATVLRPDTGEITTGAGDLGDGEGLGLGGAGGTATFFGIEAQGQRFAFIVDVSGSMAAFGRIEALRQELVEAVSTLDEHAEFSIILFNHESWSLMDGHTGRMTWIRATQRGKRDAIRKINTEVQPGGGTVPSPGFMLAFSLEPVPDVIYFMTDGIFAESEAAAIIAMNSDHRVPIHAICFASRAAEQMMRRIAQLSGGSYTHIEGPGE